VKLIDAIHDNLRNLGVDKLDVVNLRVGEVLRPSEGSIEEPLTELAELQRQGLIRHLGLSNVTPRQFAEAQKISEIVCIQNFSNIAQRDDDAFVDELINAKRRVRTLLPTGRIYSVAIIGAGRSRGIRARDPSAGRARVVASARTQCSADPRYVFGQTSPRESPGCCAATFSGNNCEARLNRGQP